MTGASRTRGFLFADLRGYTDFVERRGDHAAAELLDRYRQLVRSTIAAFAGAEIKTEGDSFFVVLDSASGAVQCGLAIAAAAAAATADDPDHPIAVGVGIHAGETVETAEGYVGSAVNIAARVCAQAHAGEVVVTETVRLLTRTFLEVEFTPLGKRPLKGVPEPVPLFRVAPARTAAALTSQRGQGVRRVIATSPAVVRWGTVAIALLIVAGGLAFIAINSGRGGVPPSPSSSELAGAPSGPLLLPELVDVPTYKGDATRRGIQPGPALVVKPVVAWEQRVGRSDKSGSPIVVDGMVIIGTDAGLTAWDARTGAPRWTFPGEAGDLKFNGTPSASAADGLVFMADTDGEFHAVDLASGVERWNFAGPVNTSTRSIVVDRLVYTGSDDGTAYGLEVTTGKSGWTRNVPAAVTDITVVADTVYISVADGRLYAFALADKHERWHAPQQVTAARAGIPAIDGETIFNGSFQQDADVTGAAILYAIDSATGKVGGRWLSPSGTQTSGVAAKRGGTVYVAAPEDGLFALQFEAGTFRVLWNKPAPAVYTAPALVDEVLYLAGYDGRLLAYRASTGDELWDMPIAEETHNTGPVVTGGMLFQADEDGVLRAYIEPALKALLPSPAPSLSPSPSPGVAGVPNPASPFQIVDAVSWATTGLATPLQDGLAVGPDGLLYVLDSKPSVTVIDPVKHKVVTRWGRQGTGAGEFDLTRPDNNVGFGGIGVGPDGLVYVGDGSNNRVQVFKPDGSFVRQFPIPATLEGQVATQLKVGPDGSIYVLNAHRVIHKFTSTGTLLWQIPGPDGLQSLAVRSDGKLVVACEGCDHLLVLDPADGTIVGRVSDPTSTRDHSLGGGLMSLDPNDNIYVAQFDPGPAELVFNPSGKYLAGFVNGDGKTSAPFQSVDKQGTWGNMFWASPVFGQNGLGYSFNESGLITLKVTLP